MTEHLDLRTPEGRQQFEREVRPLWHRGIESRRRTIEAVAARHVEGPHIVTAGAQRKRTQPGEMNATERRYVNEVLIPDQQRGALVCWYYEAITFRLAPHTTYTPDFMVFAGDGITFVEIKGQLRDDASVKFKVAREQHQWAYWQMLRWTKRKGWQDVRI